MLELSTVPTISMTLAPTTLTQDALTRNQNKKRLQSATRLNRRPPSELTGKGTHKKEIHKSTQKPALRLFMSELWTNNGRVNCHRTCHETCEDSRCKYIPSNICLSMHPSTPEDWKLCIDCQGQEGVMSAA